jgi:hypothetical protein
VRPRGLAREHPEKTGKPLIALVLYHDLVLDDRETGVV